MSQVQRNIGAYIAPKRGTAPDEVAAGTRDGAFIDRMGFLSCNLFVDVGDIEGAPSGQTVDAKIQHAIEDPASLGNPLASDWGDYAPDGVTTAAIVQITAANTQKQIDVDLSSAKRFIRVREVTTITGGSTPNVAVGSVVTLGGADVIPTL